MARTTTTTLRRVRRFVLAGFLALVAALVALYMFGRERRPELTSVEGELAPKGEVVQIGRGFRRFEVTEDGEKLFDIEADRILSQENDLYSLENVKVTMVRDADSTYTITADSGSYSILRNEAALSGSVRIVSSDGLELSTEGLELRRRGKVIVSSAPVQIGLGGLYYGRANRVEFLFKKNRVLLAGKVEIGTLPGAATVASLRAQRTVFFRDTHNFLAEGNVRLRRGADTLQARRLSVNLDSADRQVLFVLASWDVEASLGQTGDDGLPSTATVAGDQLSIVFNDETAEPERLEIDSPAGGLARLTVVDATRLTRTVQADYLWADFAGGRIETAQGLGGVTLEEGLGFAPKALLRRICSETIDASYDATGSLRSLKLSGDVSYDEPSLQAAGDELTALGENGTIDLVGDMAWIASPEGRLEAPRIHLDRAAGRAEATDGVRAEMASGSGPDLAKGGETAAPLRIEAARADWTAEPQSFVFQDNVRAWQEDNFLVSQTLGLEGEELVAGGGVRSVWHERTDPAAEEDPPAVTVSATKMRYNPDERRVVYEGSAQIVQGGRRMACPLLQLELNENDDFERMYCEGGSQIVDGDGGSNISGDAAIYSTEAGKVKVVGDPVRLSQAGGGTISARLMVYDFATAIAEIDSVKDETAEFFMSSSEYFKQFGFAQPTGTTAPPLVGEGAPPVIDPLTGLPVQAPPVAVDPATGLPATGTGLPAPGTGLAAPGTEPPVPAATETAAGAEPGLVEGSEPGVEAAGDPPAVETGAATAADPPEEAEGTGQSDDGGTEGSAA